MLILIKGIIFGLTISLMALAFSVVYLPSRIFHVALGGIFALIPFVIWSCWLINIPTWLAIMIAVGMGVFCSMLCELLNHAPLEKKQASPEIHMITSLGLYTIITQTIALIWGSQSRYLRTGLTPEFSFTFFSITYPELVAGIVSFSSLVIFYFCLKYSKFGLLFRAMSDNKNELAVQGYNLKSIRYLAFGVSGLLCSIAALVRAYDFGFDPYSGFAMVLLGLVAVIVGGRMSFIGPVVGGLLLGIIQYTVNLWTSSLWHTTLTFLILVLFLFFRPDGIIAYKVRLEEKA